jgi:hypothetical protein
VHRVTSLFVPQHLNHNSWYSSRDFGEIFGDLLPGNNAKLQYAERGNLAAGLEVKVQLGTVWKQSLTELSGGQRSLIALSLIMSLLQFKPAPMYILDEIDAALDLSHTQHIGELFKNRFKNSQFIVVSLKDGLFNNANVLFRTKFRDGTSIVEVCMLLFQCARGLIILYSKLRSAARPQPLVAVEARSKQIRGCFCLSLLNVPSIQSCSVIVFTCYLTIPCPWY